MPGVQPCCFQLSEKPFSSVEYCSASCIHLHCHYPLCPHSFHCQLYSILYHVKSDVFCGFCCSFLQTEYARMENGRFVYRIHRSPMCEYMINFIHKLKHLPEKYMMNSVLENFTILQVKNLFLSLLYSASPSGF